MKSHATQLPPEGHLIDLNGIQMYYEVHGEGPPLVLLHGYFGSTLVWQPYIAALSKQFKLIIPDLRGHGRSTNPSKQFTQRQSALDIFALLDQLEIDRFKAIGFSAGGMMLLHMATQHPARVEAMVLIGTAHYIPEQGRAIQRQWTVDSEEIDWDKYRPHHARGDEQTRELVIQFHSFSDVYDDVNFTPPYLSTITAKTLVMLGDSDPFFPVSIAVEMHAAIPNAYLWIVPNGSHEPMLVHPEVFTQTALEFLRGDWDIL